jgi:hypothetical protein
MAQLSEEEQLRRKIWGDLPNYDHPAVACSVDAPCELCSQSVNLIFELCRQYAVKREAHLITTLEEYAHSQGVAYGTHVEKDIAFVLSLHRLTPPLPNTEENRHA